MAIAVGLIAPAAGGAPCLAEIAETPAAKPAVTGAPAVVTEKLRPSAELVAKLHLPPGFKIDLFANDLINARMLAVAASGDVYVTRPSVGDVVLLRDGDGDGKAESRKSLASRPGMHGIAIDGETLYLATGSDVYRTAINKEGTLSELTRIIDDLPDGGFHPAHALGVSPDRMLYISSGSTCDVCEETNPESAAILEATPDGARRTLFATGLRNTIAFAWHPETAELWGMDHGIDRMGDNEPAEELNRLVEGKTYGWPQDFADNKLPQDGPTGVAAREERARTNEKPVLLYAPQSAPMQMAFSSGTAFPEEYRGDAFVAMRGSWNRNPPVGHEVVRIDFESGKPLAIKPFLTGFLLRQDNGSWGQFGRPVGVAFAKDGSLLVADEMGGVIYRISYDTPASVPAPDAPVAPSAGSPQAGTAKEAGPLADPAMPAATVDTRKASGTESASLPNLRQKNKFSRRAVRTSSRNMMGRRPRD